MKNLFLTIITLFAITAQAGQEGGGGGIGIGHEGKIYLYDFIESGLENSAYINTTIPDQMNAAPYVQATMASPEVQKLLVNKLNEIYLVAPESALEMLGVITAYQWRYVLPKLNKTNDLGRSPVIRPNAEIQLAYRDDQTKIVTIDREYMSKMPLYNQVGLYIHEIYYALTHADCVAKGHPGYKDHYNDYSWCGNNSRLAGSYEARAMTAYVFLPTFKLQTAKQYTDFYNRTVRKTAYAGHMSSKIVDPKNFIPYADFVRMQTPEFKQECAQFKTETTNTLIQASLEFEKMLIAYSKAYPSKNGERNGYNLILSRYMVMDFYFEEVHRKLPMPYRSERTMISTYDIPKLPKFKFDRVAMHNSVLKVRALKAKQDNYFQKICLDNQERIFMIDDFIGLNIEL